MASSDTNQKVEDGTFLAEEFDIPARKAARLVSNEGDADKVEAQSVGLLLQRPGQIDHRQFPVVA